MKNIQKLINAIGIDKFKEREFSVQNVLDHLVTLTPEELSANSEAIVNAAELNNNLDFVALHHSIIKSDLAATLAYKLTVANLVYENKITGFNPEQIDNELLLLCNECAQMNDVHGVLANRAAKELRGILSGGLIDILDRISATRH